MDSSLPRPAPPRSLIDRVREWVVWFGPGRLVATALAVIAVVVGGTWLLRGSPEPSGRRRCRSHHTRRRRRCSMTAPSTTVATSIVVYVAGAVVVPGIYTLAVSARVNDAVIAAGGAVADADLDVVNLAAALHDGERIYVPMVGEPIRPAIDVPAAQEAAVAGRTVNINSATAEQLDVLPGVGPATAAAIVAHRQQHGPFQDVEQLGDVRGIGPAKLDALRGLVTV